MKGRNGNYSKRPSDRGDFDPPHLVRNSGWQHRILAEPTGESRARRMGPIEARRPQACRRGWPKRRGFDGVRPVENRGQERPFFPCRRAS